jgi:ABC-type sugar transport system permease subunit
MATRQAVAAPARLVLPQRLFGRDWALGYALTTPIIVVLFGLIAYPFGYAIWLSLNDVKIGGTPTWVGLGNYANLLFGMQSDELLNSAFVTIKLVALALACKFVIGMVSALTLNSAIRSRNVWRGILFLPWSVPAVVAAYSWKWLFDENHGMLDLAGMQLGLITEPIQWLGDYNLALWAIIGATVWQGTPFWTMTYLAGLASIPNELYEAAQIDGAGTTQRFFFITLPNLAPLILITLMLSSMWTANGFQMIYILTNGGPANATTTFPLLAYRWGISNFDLGMGASVPLLFFPIFAVMIYFISRRLLREA